MPPPVDCPGIEPWAALEAASVAPDVREQWARHLDLCPVCQERLDRAEQCGEELLSLFRQLGDPTAAPQDPTLTEVLERLHDTKSGGRAGSGHPADLYFLLPDDRPGLLGTLGPYEVREVIGQGGMGIVLKAFDPALQRLVAIKVLAPALAGSTTARRRFTREAQAAAAVCHEHVVAVHGVREADGLPYLVMPYVPGESLQARLDRTGPPAVAEVVRIGLEAASGLAAAHAQGLIHRDVKPANILLEGDLARVKITDFGLARTADDVALTRAGTVAGTPEYMAPEQARGEAVDHRADLFSLGSVLYACCTGQPPFRGQTALAVLRQVSDGSAAPVRSRNADVPAWLEGLIARLMARDPADRFGSAAEVARLLEGYRAHLRAPATAPAPDLPAPRAGGQPGPRPAAARPWLPTLVAVAALGLLGVLAALGTLPQEPAAPTEVYQDFRGGRTPVAPFELVGPDAEERAHADDGGLRITLPADRMRLTEPVGVALRLPLSGDFEMTGAYELLSADRPRSGTGVALALNVSIGSGRKFLRFGRFLTVEQGDVYLGQSWGNPPQPQPDLIEVPTEARSGRLRVVRQGSTVIGLVADGPGNEFRELYRSEFGADATDFVRFVVHNNNSPAAVDARLVDFRVRYGSQAADQGAGPAPPPVRPPPVGSKAWLVAGGLVALLLVLTLGVWLAVWHRRRARTAPRPARAKGREGGPGEPPGPVTFACPGCGKKLRAKAGVSGRAVKCPQCGQAVLVPAASPGGEAGRPPS